jgi:hypothetical protein
MIDAISIEIDSQLLPLRSKSLNISKQFSSIFHSSLPTPEFDFINDTQQWMKKIWQKCCKNK